MKPTPADDGGRADHGSDQPNRYLNHRQADRDDRCHLIVTTGVHLVGRRRAVGPGDREADERQCSGDQDGAPTALDQSSQADHCLAFRDVFTAATYA